MPLADPPVGTRGLPFRDRFFSGEVGRSQLPALAAVLENGRRVVEGPFFDVCWVRVERGVMRGRRGEEDIESFWN